MINITILTSKNLHQNSIGLLYPLLKWKKKINLEKIYFKIKYNLREINNSDIIILDSKYHRNYWIKDSKIIYSDLNFLKKKCSKLIYCDTADSSGWIQSEVFNFVDKYWKCQILKDKKLYLKKFYDRRIFTDFYYNLLKKQKTKNINYETEDWSSSLNTLDLDKIVIFWNTSLVDYSLKSHYLRIFFKKYFKKIYANNSVLRKVTPSSQRKHNFMLNFNTKYSRKYIGYQRQKLTEIFQLETNKRIGRIVYFKKLRNSKICISPFGWGEITFRDYECFLNGALLLKPNMDHLETWPNLYQKNKTYIDFDWDLENVREICDNILDSYDEYLELAFAGQTNYLSYLNGDIAEDKFVKKLKQLIEYN